jgi:hypothetical protein
MTIAAGFCCEDGVVLCADTQLTIPGSLKYPESKIRMSPDLRSCPVYAFCDDMDYQKQCIFHFNEAIRGAESKREHVIRALEQKAVELHQTYYELYTDPSEKLNVNMLLSLQLGNKQRLFKIYGPKVAPVETLECIGAGNYLARALAGTYWTSDISMHRTGIICTYILADVKKYVDGCGGESHIICLGDNGLWSMFPSDGLYFTIEELEADYEYWKTHTRELALDYADFKVGESSFERDLVELTDDLTRVRGDRMRRYDEVEMLKMEADLAESRRLQEKVKPPEDET